MADANQEQSMEEILASIRRIIADDGDGALQQPPPLHSVPLADSDDVLELTNAVQEPERAPPSRDVPLTAVSPLPSPSPLSEPAATIVSDHTASASAQALAALSTMIVKPESGDNTLEGLVRDMLKPMLKQWLDTHLPDLVEQMVAREIARITSRKF